MNNRVDARDGPEFGNVSAKNRLTLGAALNTLPFLSFDRPFGHTP